MNRGRAGILVLCGLLVAVTALAGQSTCEVRYLSAEHVYLDAGADLGLAVGMQVKVTREGKAVADLEVVFVADHSATATIAVQHQPVQVGDKVVFESAVVQESAAPVDALVTRQRPVPTRKSSVSASSGPAVRGYVGIQWDHIDAGSELPLESDLVTLPFRLHVRRFGPDLQFRAQGSLRRITRKGYSPSTPTSERLDRVNEVAVFREGRDLDWHFAVGRVRTRSVAPAGPIDGLSISKGLGGQFRIGAFGGYAPAWGTYAFDDTDQLAGFTLRWSRRASSYRTLDLILTGVGRYHEDTVSRTYVNMATTWRASRKFSLLQSAELDINNGWREDKAGESVTVSSLAFTGRYQFTRMVGIHLGYDDRLPVRTWQTRSLPDSLFNDAGRTGWRTGFRWRLQGGTSLSANGSLRTEHRTDDVNTSWSVRLHQPDWPVARLHWQASVRSFDGPSLSGWSPMLGARRSTASGWQFSADAGYFEYQSEVNPDARTNTWLRAGVEKDLTARWSAGADYRRDWGDDILGNRWFLESRYRF